MSGLIWIQTISHFDGKKTLYFENVNFDRKKSVGEHSMQKYPACTELMCVIDNNSALFVFYGRMKDWQVITLTNYLAES